MKQQRTPSFTGEVRRYVVQPFRLQSDLTADQVKLHSSIDVSDNCSFSLVAPKHGTPVTTLVESSVIVQWNSGFCRISLNASVKKGDSVIA